MLVLPTHLFIFGKCVPYVNFLSRLAYLSDTPIWFYFHWVSMNCYQNCFRGWFLHSYCDASDSVSPLLWSCCNTDSCYCGGLSLGSLRCRLVLPHGQNNYCKNNVIMILLRADRIFWFAYVVINPVSIYLFIMPYMYFSMATINAYVCNNNTSAGPETRHGRVWDMRKTIYSENNVNKNIIIQNSMRCSVTLGKSG